MSQAYHFNEVIHRRETLYVSGKDSRKVIFLPESGPSNENWRPKRTIVLEVQT